MPPQRAASKGVQAAVAKTQAWRTAAALGPAARAKSRTTRKSGATEGTPTPSTVLTPELAQEIRNLVSQTAREAATEAAKLAIQETLNARSISQAQPCASNSALSSDNTPTAPDHSLVSSMADSAIQSSLLQITVTSFRCISSLVPEGLRGAPFEFVTYFDSLPGGAVRGVPPLALSQCIVPNTNITLAHDQTHSDCNQICTCTYGQIACISACPPSRVRPSKDCPNPAWRVPPGECCEKKFCDPCPKGRWGVGCTKKCGACAGEEEPKCNIRTGRCPDRSPPCLPGYFGSQCRKSCPKGKYGRGCSFKCGQCSGGHKECNVTSGACTGIRPRCQPGWSGLKCDRECREGFYGPDCTSECGACSAGKCSPQDGSCEGDVPLCKSGYWGSTCKELCRPGTFGPECQWDCGGCYAGPTTCKPQNGVCPEGTPRCEVGYMGEACKACPPGTWGVDCGQNCSAHCLRGSLECDARDGTCLGGCEDDFLGDQCDARRTGNPDLATVIGLAVGGGVLILLGISACTLVYLHRHRSRNKLHQESSYLTPVSSGRVQMTKEAVKRTPTYEVPMNANGARDTEYVPASWVRPATSLTDGTEFSFYETLLPSSDWNVPMDRLELSNKFLVQGNFGETQLANWRYMQDSDQTIPVGLKRFTGNGSDERKNVVNQELEKLRTLDRCLTTLTVLGLSVQTHSGEMFLLLEWTEEGNLLDYLRRPRSAEEAQTVLREDSLIKFCLEVALAMVHLSSRRVTPVDLAARTILLDKNFDAKVTGFVSFWDEERETEQTWESARWASIETLLQQNSSAASDVWSYGVLMWEIFSLGEKPYADITAKELKGQLEAGRRLGHPARASTNIYVLMTECWQADPSLRPSFTDIVKRLREIANPYCPMAVINENSVAYSTAN